jgi:hypothetical protein
MMLFDWGPNLEDVGVWARGHGPHDGCVEARERLDAERHGVEVNDRRLPKWKYRQYVDRDDYRWEVDVMTGNLLASPWPVARRVKARDVLGSPDLGAA